MNDAQKHAIELLRETADWLESSDGNAIASSIDEQASRIAYALTSLARQVEVERCRSFFQSGK